MNDLEQDARRAMNWGLYGDALFSLTGIRCNGCGALLEIHYCESCVYAVRCKKCGIVSLVVAKNPRQAAMKVSCAPSGAGEGV